MKYKKALSFLIGAAMLFLFIHSSTAQTWSRRYEFPILGSGNGAHSIERHPDGFLIYQQGNTGQLSETGQHIGLLLIDPNGDYINSTDIEEIDVDYLNGRPNCMDAKNFEYVCSATKDPQDGIQNNAKAQFLHYNLNLELLHFYEHESAAYYESESAFFDINGGFVIGGSTKNTIDTTLGAFIMKLDENALLEWETIIPGDSPPNETEIYGSNVINAHDGGYLLTAAERFLTEFDECVFINFKRNRLLYKFDINGEVEWTKVWDNCYAEGPFNILATSDGNYVISTGTVVQEISNPDYVRFVPTLIKIDSNGNEIWNKSYGNHNVLSALQGLIETEEGDYVASGFKYGPPLLNRSGILVKVNSDGDSLWFREVQWEANTYSAFEDVISDGEGGFVACGNVRGIEQGFGQDTWVVRFDSEGCVLGECFVGIEETEPLENILVYPNPAVDRLTIEIPDYVKEQVEIEVYSSTGQLVHSETTRNTGAIRLQCNQWAKGIYVVKLATSERVFQAKVVVDR